MTAAAAALSASPSSPSSPSSLALAREAGRLSLAWWRFGVFGLPLSLLRQLIREPSFDRVLSEERLCDTFGDNALRLFNDLGPIYGKAGQMILSRLSPPLHEVADSLRLTRLYKDWPPMPFSEVALILDREIPLWRTELKVDSQPLGVASLAQVHGATDSDGRQWVIKVVKPAAKKRLMESVAAMEQVADLLTPLAVTAVSRRLIKELRELAHGFRLEISLGRERATILKVQEKLRSKRQKLLVIPAVNERFCSDDVLTVERFIGTSLADIVAGRVEVQPAMRQKLAKTMLSELLVQVFELGLFHADPHAGNLILTETGEVGLFDWGLSGELLDNDRRYIAAILKAVISLDLERLVDALVAMGEESGRRVSREAVHSELKAVTQMIKKGREDPSKKPSLQALFEACLKSAERLNIPVPDGLLMMAKSLVTIEGLARGIDPSVSLSRVATPVLLRAARPSLRELMALGMKLPGLARQMMAT